MPRVGLGREREVDGQSSAGDMEMDSGADWLLGDEGSESSSAAILFNHGPMISILLAGINIFV